MLRSLALGLTLLGVVEGIHADPPAVKVLPAPLPKPAQGQVVRADGTPVVVQAAPAPIVVKTVPGPVSTQPCPCEQAVRPGRAWLAGCRPILIDDHFRYEPRIRDIRYSMPSSTLPGTGLGAPDTLFVLPPYQVRDGYFRLFDRR